MNKRVAIIGECMLELTRDTSASSSASLPMNLSYGGDTLNTAVYMARLGAEVDYFTALGDDPYSDWMIQQWEAEHIGCASVVRVPGRLPGIYSIETDSRGERSFHYWRDQAPARELFDEFERRCELFEQLMAYDLIYLSGITLSLYQSSCLDALFAFLNVYRKKGGIVAFDGNFRPARWPDLAYAKDIYTKMYQLTDIALPTLEDEQLLYPADSAKDVVVRLQACGVTEMVLKKGAEGCLTVFEGETEEVQANMVDNVVDTTAAGDSFNAAYLAARIKEQPAPEAAVAGHNLAGLVIQYPGATIPKSAHS